MATTPLPEPLAGGFPAATREAWSALVAKVLKGADPERRLVARTADGLRIEPLYTRPAGEAPLPLGGIARADGRWDVRQRHGLADAAATNAAILADLAGGVSSILLQIEAPGQRGLPYTASHLGQALDGVLLDVCPIVLDAGEYTVDVAGSLMDLWRQRGIAPERCRGGLSYDPLGNLARTGALYNSLAKSLAIAAQLLADVGAYRHVTALVADGRPYHAAGASEAQELAAVLATLVAYLRAAEAAGHAPAVALPRIEIALAADADQLLTMAKLRAVRRLIERVAEACGAAGTRPIVVAETASRMMARRDPWVNMLRTTIACAAAALGGADAITVAPFTSALGEPDAFARRIARNTQMVLMEESGLGRVADPAAGSFALEAMTNDLAAKAWARFQDIEAQGGMGEALIRGTIQAEIARTAEERQRRIATGREELTGVSAFPFLGPDGVEVKPFGPVPSADLNGQRAKPLASLRLAEPFERLRDAADAARSAGREPRVFLATLGPEAVHGTRATWITNYLAAGGIAALRPGEIHASADAGRLFAESGASVACICSSDEVYGELAEATAGALKAAGARRVLLAGRPGEHEALYRAAGVDGFLAAGGDAIAALTELHGVLGLS